MGFLDLLRNTPDEEDIRAQAIKKLKELNAAGQQMTVDKISQLQATSPKARADIMQAAFGAGTFRQPNLERGMDWYKNAEMQDNLMMQAMLQSAIAGKQAGFDAGTNNPGVIHKDPTASELDEIARERRLRDLRAKYGQRGFEAFLARMQDDQQGR
jgi:hypothetical protein